jgi:hypothetical protein
VVEYVVAVFLVMAIAFAFVRAFQHPDGVDFGWLAIGFLITAVWLLPTLLTAAHSRPAP